MKREYVFLIFKFRIADYQNRLRAMAIFSENTLVTKGLKLISLDREVIHDICQSIINYHSKARRRTCEIVLTSGYRLAIKKQEMTSEVRS